MGGDLRLMTLFHDFKEFKNRNISDFIFLLGNVLLFKTEKTDTT